MEQRARAFPFYELLNANCEARRNVAGRRRLERAMKTLISKTLISRLARNVSGATAIEYAMIAGGIALAIIAAVTTISVALNTTFTNLAAL
jgi:pilus assembly protein Flp/PilA